MAAIFGVGAKLCSENKLTIGEITAFLFYMLQILINFMIIATVLGSIMTVSHLTSQNFTLHRLSGHLRKSLNY